MGTRLREETEYKPKPMVEIGGKPILWHIMKHYSFYGHNEFILALGYKGNVIRNYFLNYFNRNNNIAIDFEQDGKVSAHAEKVAENWKVTLVETGAESMTGYRVKLCSPYITGDRFMLTYGDAVSNVDIGKLIEFNIKMDTVGTVTGVFPPSRFGDLITDGNMVTHFKQQLKDIEHQSPINGGYFVFKSEFLNLIPDDPTVDLEKLPIDRIVENHQLSVFKHPDFWQCMDTYRDNQFLEKMWKENPVWKIWE